MKRAGEVSLLLSESLAACVFGQPALKPGDWPQFRGPGGLGVSHEKGLPGDSERDAEVRFCLYLLWLDGEHAYFSYVPDYKRIRRYPVFDADIGKPVSDYEL